MLSLPADTAVSEHAFVQRIGGDVQVRRSAAATRDALGLALGFIAALEVALAPWMLWDGWVLHVGCDVCAEHGPHAGCWATTRCHGYLRGCGCEACARRVAREIAPLAGRAA